MEAISAFSARILEIIERRAAIFNLKKKYTPLNPFELPNFAQLPHDEQMNITGH